MINFDPNFTTLLNVNRPEKSRNYYTNFEFVDVTVVVTDRTQTIVIILPSQFFFINSEVNISLW